MVIKGSKKKRSFPIKSKDCQKNFGNCTWQVPDKAPEGTYRISIANKGTSFKKGLKSAQFSIGSKAGKLRVMVPSSGKQKWKAGKTHTIRWVKGDGGANVKIQLLRSDKHYKWVSKKTKNDGKYPWKVPGTVKTGNKYKIKITSSKDKKVTDSSDKAFTITAKSVSKPKVSLSCTPSSIPTTPLTQRSSCPRRASMSILWEIRARVRLVIW